MKREREREKCFLSVQGPNPQRPRSHFSFSLLNRVTLHILAAAAAAARLDYIYTSSLSRRLTLTLRFASETKCVVPRAMIDVKTYICLPFYPSPFSLLPHPYLCLHLTNSLSIIGNVLLLYCCPMDVYTWGKEQS